MLNKVLVFFSEIIRYAWQRSYMTLLPPPWPSSSLEQGRAHTQILISAAVQPVRDCGAQYTVTLKKNKKYQNVPWDLEILFM